MDGLVIDGRLGDLQFTITTKSNIQRVKSQGYLKSLNFRKKRKDNWQKVHTCNLIRPFASCQKTASMKYFNVIFYKPVSTDMIT